MKKRKKSHKHTQQTFLQQYEKEEKTLNKKYFK